MNRRVQHSLCIDYVFITIISLAYYSTDVYLFDALVHWKTLSCVCFSVWPEVFSVLSSFCEQTALK